MRDAASSWFSSLDEKLRDDYRTVIKHFEDRYLPAPISRWKRASEIWSRDQRQTESVDDYYADMLRKARDIDQDVSEEDPMTRYAIMRGLRPTLRTYVMQQNPRTTTELLEAAKIAEATVTDSAPSFNTEILDAISRLEQRVTNSINNDRDNRRVTFNRSPSQPRRDTRRYRDDDNTARRSPTPRRSWGRPAPTTPPPAARYQQQTTPGFVPRYQQPMMPTTTQQPVQPGCTRCGRLHLPGNCVARGKLCRNCGKMNHFAICCRARQRLE